MSWPAHVKALCSPLSQFQLFPLVGPERVPLLNNELKIRSKKYLVQSRSFAEMLEATIRKYQNRTRSADFHLVSVGSDAYVAGR